MRLALVRHAEARPGDDDHARPLTARGQREAARLGRWLADRGWVPDRVLGSDSARTRQTWEHMAPALGERPAIWTGALYLEGWQALRAELGALPPTVHTALALGHNPGWELAASWLAGRRVGLGTASAALLEGEGRWDDLRLLEVVCARDLR